MKRYLYFIILFLSLLKAENLVDIYRKKGLQSVQTELEKLLKSEKYWRGYLKDINTTLGYFENEKYLILSDKNDKTMSVYRIKSGKISKVFSNDIIVGKNGEKKKEGDLVTPVGAYKIVLRFKPKNGFYGPVAFALSYPNLYDRLQGRDGHGIWIHGYPIDDENRSDTTKGCLVLKNDQLLELNSTIEPHKCYVVIGEDSLPAVRKFDIAKILAFLYRWRDSWIKSDIDRYLSFYSKDFKRFDGKDFRAFSDMKRSIFSRKEQKSIIFKNINIVPYPNLENKKIFRVDFYENYRAKHYKYSGSKELYIKVASDNVKIIVER